MFYLSDICLLCLNFKQLESVSMQKDSGNAVQEELKYCLPEITISKLGFPEFICSSCRTAVHSFYKFKETCLENYSRLIQYTKILQGSSDLRGQKFSELKIQINNLNLKDEEQYVDSTLNIKEEFEVSFYSLEEYIQRTGNVKEECDLILLKQLNNEELMRERQQEMYSKFSIEIENQASLQSLNEDEHDGKEEFVAPEDRDDYEFYQIYTKNELASENEQDSASRSSCEDNNQPNEDEVDFKVDTDNVNTICNNSDTGGEEHKHKQNPLNARIHKNVRDNKFQICNKELEQNNTFNKHLKKNTESNNFKCSICDKKVSRKKILNDHMKIHTGIKDFNCSICEKKFFLESCLKVHMKIHTEITDFKCPICDNKFIYKGDLKVHMKSHAENRDFKCSVCDKGFLFKKRLIQHMKIHAGIRDFKCSICEKKFIHKADLKRHIKIHTAIKDFKCSVCDKKFLMESYLKVHMKFHTGIKDFKCSTCDKKFVLKKHLVQHRKVHAENGDLKCSICDKKFSLKKYLEKHMNIHAGIDFKCSICDKKFMYKSNLEIHMKIHAGIRDFKCSICDMEFVQKRNLTKHMIKHANKE